MNFSHVFDLCVYLSSHSKKMVSLPSCPALSWPLLCIHRGNRCVFTSHVTALVAEIRGVRRALQPSESENTQQSPGQEPQKLGFSVSPYVYSQTPGCGQPGSGWGGISCSVEEDCSASRCHAASLESMLLHHLLGYGLVGRSQGVRRVRVSCFTCSRRSRGLAEKPSDWFDSGIFSSCFSILLPPS